MLHNRRGFFARAVAVFPILKTGTYRRSASNLLIGLYPIGYICCECDHLIVRFSDRDIEWVSTRSYLRMQSQRYLKGRDVVISLSGG